MGESSPLAHSPTLAAAAAGDDGERIAAGAQVGDYVVERFIGAGAMGEVYAGRHPVIGKRVAIKVLRPELAASAEGAERFIREARAVNQVEHENVVDVFGFGRLDDGRLYLVMDLVEGKSLRAALINGPLDVASTLAILDKVADALDAAHARGVVHRDLKPDNIVLSNATPPKVFVLDFGIAKLISTANAGEKTGPGTLTGQGTWLGTPGYMAPEQWSVDGAGPASDRYALGVIAFELLAGAPPFASSSVPGMMEQHFRAEVPALSARGAVGVPPAVDAVLARALAKDPEARYPTARAFVTALRDAAGSGAQRGRGAIAMSAGARRLWKPAAAGVGVLAIAVVAVVVTRKDDRAPRAAVQPPVDEPAHDSAMIDVASEPAGAEIKLDGRLAGVTPARLPAKQGARAEVVLAKPGYLPVTHAIEKIELANVVHERLVPVTEFAGTWRLANGELRRLERKDDQVDVFKVSAAHGGAQTFFKHYDFIAAEHGVAFAADDEIVDPRAPNEPSCHVRVHVEYRYDPAEADVLVQRRDKVKIGFSGGSCVVQTREVESTSLERVGHASDGLDFAAPVGRVEIPTKTRPTKTVAKPSKQPPVDPKIAKKKALEQQKVAPPTKSAAQQYTKGNDSMSQIVPQPQASPPQLDAQGQAAQQAAPQVKK